jgi:hypothetical protein
MSHGELPLPPFLVETFVVTFAVFVSWKFEWRVTPCFSPSSLVCSKHPTLSAACPFQFLIYYSVLGFFCRAGVSVSRGLCCFIPGVALWIPCVTYLLTCWSASPKQFWSQHLAAQEPSCFLSVVWHVEALWGLGVQGVRVLLILGGFFCQVWLQCFSKIFDLWSSRCLPPPSSCHLGSLLFYFLKINH